MPGLTSALRANNYGSFLKVLNQRVTAMFPNNPSIKPISFSESEIDDQGIRFNIKILHLLAQKPSSNKETFSPLINKENQPKKDPFLPPYEQG